MYKLNTIDNIKLLQFTCFEKTGVVRHALSTRHGGVSTGEAATMNFGFNRKDTAENIKENFRRLLTAVDMNYENVVLPNQTHSDVVHVVTMEDAGKGLHKTSDIKGVDALITNVPNIPICVFHADCMPILFLDVKNKAIGIAHSGWKSTVLNIASKTVEAMRDNYRSDPMDIICAVGPSIGSCHFEVDEDVAALFGTDFTVARRKEKNHVDLWGVVKKQLVDAGISEQNIAMSSICTVCNKDIYYSYRGDNHKTGSMISVMEIV